VTGRWSARAPNDLLHIKRYISRDSAAAGEKVAKALFERPDLLSRFPNAGREVGSRGSAAFRELIEGDYRLSVPQADHVLVPAIIHGRRDFRRMMRSLLRPQ